MDTVICLDVSASMKGEAWNQALGFIRGFIECELPLQEGRSFCCKYTVTRNCPLRL